MTWKACAPQLAWLPRWAHTLSIQDSTKTPVLAHVWILLLKRYWYLKTFPRIRTKIIVISGDSWLHKRFEHPGIWASPSWGAILWTPYFASLQHASCGKSPRGSFKVPQQTYHLFPFTYVRLAAGICNIRGLNSPPPSVWQRVYRRGECVLLSSSIGALNQLT